MTFFVDANVVIYTAVTGPWREACLDLLEAVAGGRAEGRTSPSVLEEVWHVERSGRAGPIDGMTKRAYAVFAPLLPVTDEAFRTAMALDATGLGTNDRLHVGTCLAHGLEVVVSADRAFDAVAGVRRVDPADGGAVRALIDSH